MLHPKKFNGPLEFIISRFHCIGIMQLINPESQAKISPMIRIRIVVSEHLICLS